jgi:Putative peptidoglycan binding domain/CHAP domain
MATAQGVLNAARSKLGVSENPPGSNQVEFAAWAGIPGQPWCAAFASWCLDQGGALDVPRFVYCPYGVAEYQKAGRYGPNPSIGAVVFFQWAGENRACHVGLVEALQADGSIVTLEGNTDDAGGGSGGKVMRHVRRAFIIGYGYPEYEAVAAAAPDIPAVPVSVASNPVLRVGARGNAVVTLQRRLGVAADGIFGPITDKAVRNFQRSHGLAVDGIVGPRTWGALG